MKRKEVYSAVKKYVENIILPQFPEVTGFEIEKSKRRKIPDYVEGTKRPIDIKFYVNDIDDERDNKLFFSVRKMNKYLSIPHEFYVESYLEHN